MHKILASSASKTFLTDRPDEHSAVGWSAVSEVFISDEGENSTPSVDSTLRLQDCTRSISIEFDAYGNDVTQETFDSRLEKLDTLISELNLFRESLKTAYTSALSHKENEEQK